MSHLDLDEKELVRRARRGDRLSFARLVEAHQDRLFNAVARMVGNRDDAADLVQEVFLKAFRALDEFREEARFFTWLYRIAMNAAISHRRRAPARGRVVSLSAPGGGAETEGEPGLSLDPEDPAGGPGRDAELREMGGAVERAIAGLPAEERALVVLRDVDGCTYEEIAEVLSISLATVRSRLHRARLDLRGRLEKWLGD
ncbi:MAG: sigma-70 family RNA polymerase sigma factor [Planctomycetes bacterium]|nr:sigma-70 family RNA polymerase sigma factor [Planctomycetota bacterium]